MQFLVVFAIFFIVMIGFILSIKFSRYKQRPERSSCCGGGHCEIGDDGKVQHTHPVPDDHVCCKEVQA